MTTSDTPEELEEIGRGFKKSTDETIAPQYRRGDNFMLEEVGKTTSDTAEAVEELDDMLAIADASNYPDDRPVSPSLDFMTWGSLRRIRAAIERMVKS